jgi:hypothetical protein
MKLFILGDSHTVALGLGLQRLIGTDALDASDDVRALKVLSSPLLLDPFFELRDGGVRFLDEAAGAALAELTGRDSLSAGDADAVFAFSLGFTAQLLLAQPDWRSFAPWSAGRADGRQLLSSGVVRAIALKHFRHVVDFYRSVRALGLRCLAVASPPLIPGDRWFPPEVDPELLLEIDLLMRSAMIDALARLGVPTVLPPARVHEGGDRRRWRDPRYGSFKGAHDGHADAEFGRLMVRRILQAARTMSGSASW